MTKLIFSFALILFSSNVLAQNTFPASGKTGIGTVAATGPIQNALQIQYVSGTTDSAVLRLANGGSNGSSVFGILGLMPDSSSVFSSLSKGEDLILHEHSQGDLILTNFQSTSLSHPFGAIRLATTPDTAHKPLGPPFYSDVERETITPNGNIGFNLPPDTGINSGLGYPRDQFQLGGGVTPYPGNAYPSAPLTMFGGNRFENVMGPNGLFPGDYRYLAFNHWVDHADSSSNRNHRFEPVGSSGVYFAESAGGLLQLVCSPYDTTKTLTAAMKDFSKGTTLQISGNQGLALWFLDTTTNPYHHLLDIMPPRDTGGGITRNTNGLSYFHTPVCITSDHPGDSYINFLNLSNVHPNLGDGFTWMLAVNGSALFKEAYVNTNDWPDYVFLPNYPLMSIDEFGNYLKAEHHLPEIPSAQSMNGTVPLGNTEEVLTKQVEEMALYIVQLNNKIEVLEAKVESFEKGGK